MSKILYLIGDNQDIIQNYTITEDTILYHYAVDSSSQIEVHLTKPGVNFTYYYSVINHDDHDMKVSIYHDVDHTTSNLYNHGVNTSSNKLFFDVSSYVPKDSPKCVCNQENQIINLENGKSTICPKLYIDQYDVDSSHAAYIGSFPEDTLFYMMSRGISFKACNELLMKGFLLSSDSIDLSKIDFFIKKLESL